MIRRKHDAEGRNDNVETPVGKTQRFRIGLPVLDAQTFRRGTGSTVLEQARG